jgi:acetyltransferase-like isoleucine patch superfamily enzyme
VFLAADDGHPIDPIARRSEPGSGTGSIEIEDDVWIGESAIVTKDVRIGRAAIVATGSVVTRDVAPFTVVGGNPARVLKQIDAEGRAELPDER